ncbi:MAG: hypothetical protein AABX33_08990 [Nanoarchaeota archaeon]
MSFKAQISVEFFIFVGIAVLIAIAFEIASLQYLNDFRIQKENDAVKDLALKIQRELLIATYVQEGYAREFEVPDKLDNIQFEIKTQNSVFYIQSAHAYLLLAIPFIVGNVSKGTNIINKTNGAIYINSKAPSAFADSTICQNAQNIGLCGGLDILFGTDYRVSCCNEYFYCC